MRVMTSSSASEDEEGGQRGEVVDGHENEGTNDDSGTSLSRPPSSRGFFSRVRANELMSQYEAGELRAIRGAVEGAHEHDDSGEIGVALTAALERRMRRRRFIFKLLMTSVGVIFVTMLFVGIFVGTKNHLKHNKARSGPPNLIHSPENLSEMCHVDVESWTACEDACRVASCCHEDCYAEFRDLCEEYSPCQILYGNWPTPGSSQVVPHAPSDLESICTNAGDGNRDAFAECEMACRAAECCRDTDSFANCYSANIDICEEYYAPCKVVFDEKNKAGAFVNEISGDGNAEGNQSGIGTHVGSLIAEQIYHACSRSSSSSSETTSSCKELCHDGACCFEDGDNGCKGEKWCAYFAECSVVYGEQDQDDVKKVNEDNLKVISERIKEYCIVNHIAQNGDECHKICAKGACCFDGRCPSGDFCPFYSLCKDQLRKEGNEKIGSDDMSIAESVHVHCLGHNTQNMPKCHDICKKSWCCFQDGENDCSDEEFCTEYSDCKVVFEDEAKEKFVSETTVTTETTDDEDDNASIAETIHAHCLAHNTQNMPKCHDICGKSWCCFQNDENNCSTEDFCVEFSDCQYVFKDEAKDKFTSDKNAELQAVADRIHEHCISDNTQNMPKCRDTCAKSSCCFETGSGSCSTESFCDYYSDCKLVFKDELKEAAAVENDVDEDELAMVRQNIYENCVDENSKNMPKCGEICARGSRCFESGNESSANKEFCAYYSRCKIVFGDENNSVEDGKTESTLLGPVKIITETCPLDGSTVVQGGQCDIGAALTCGYEPTCCNKSNEPYGTEQTCCNPNGSDCHSQCGPTRKCNCKNGQWYCIHMEFCLTEVPICPVTKEPVIVTTPPFNPNSDVCPTDGSVRTGTKCKDNRLVCGFAETCCEKPNLPLVESEQKCCKVDGSDCHTECKPSIVCKCDGSEFSCAKQSVCNSDLPKCDEDGNVIIGPTEDKCPTDESSIRPGGTCSVEGLSCGVGEECCDKTDRPFKEQRCCKADGSDCHAECRASMKCNCASGEWMCYHTDFCMLKAPICDENGKTGGVTVSTGGTKPDLCALAGDMQTGDKCKAEGLTCEIGEQCCLKTDQPLDEQKCCNINGLDCHEECSPSKKCSCDDGVWACLSTDVCLHMIPHCGELSTGFVSAGSDGHASVVTRGFMFDLESGLSQGTISVEAFDLDLVTDSSSLAPEVSFQVYTRLFSHVGHEDDADGWIDLGLYEVNRGGSDSLSTLVLSEPFILPLNGEKRSFYIAQLHSDGEGQHGDMIAYDMHPATGKTLHAFDDYINLYVGTNKDGGGPFASTTTTEVGVGFSGNIRYTVTGFDDDGNGIISETAAKEAAEIASINVCELEGQVSTGFRRSSSEGVSHVGGIMFDVENKRSDESDISIVRFLLNVAKVGTHTFQVFYREGTHVGYESNPIGWIDAGVHSVEGKGDGMPSQLLLNSEVLLKSTSNRMTFFIYEMNTRDLQVFDGGSRGSYHAGNDEIAVYYGTGKLEGKFSGTSKSGLGFSGAIIYCIPGED